MAGLAGLAWMGLDDDFNVMPLSQYVTGLLFSTNHHPCTVVNKPTTIRDLSVITTMISGATSPAAKWQPNNKQQPKLVIHCYSPVCNNKVSTPTPITPFQATLLAMRKRDDYASTLLHTQPPCTDVNKPTTIRELPPTNERDCPQTNTDDARTYKWMLAATRRCAQAPISLISPYH
ncbi:hypothetical protein K443DRAFT_7406 [Laccaria amethystina LaAM-08-1]|uniref:Uncharacterized protein n=1 Tax=Laccaria amethystina LaAM-08-1 TaxID=1095629 RepID=A0A0C9XYA9_9AGAR|nr:hypothetical protein K443DRAFT_7406 [Laccaria amethystina LaAM-08-1]